MAAVLWRPFYSARFMAQESALIVRRLAGLRCAWFAEVN